MAHHEASPVGGPIMTRPFKYLLVFLAIWSVVLIWRFAAGIGAVSGLSDGYPWGIWIAFDVVTGTALACGGYAVAILCYIFNKGKYHPLVRPAILTSALGYSLAGFSIVIDVGRPWLIHNIPLRVFDWNLNSALLEVALCVMAYTGVLWLELAPAFLEKMKDASSPGLRNFAALGLRFFDKAMIWIIALGLLLPTMHQSSLGTVMLIAGDKVHGLWSTSMIPLLYLLSCVGMGYAVVVWESTVSAGTFSRPREDSMLKNLSGAMVIVLGLFLVIRLVDLVIQGRGMMMFTSGGLSVLFWVENALFLWAMLLLGAKRRQNFSNVFRAALVIIFAGALYRFDSYIVAYNPGPGWSYFPSFPELFITFGVVGLEIALYIVIVKTFPILGGLKPSESES
jgi:Ni/Fe-hydrogenase subunit HybB-like protein